MPLKNGKSQKAIQANIKTELAAGRSQKQAGKSKPAAKSGKR